MRLLRQHRPPFLSRKMRTLPQIPPARQQPRHPAIRSSQCRCVLVLQLASSRPLNSTRNPKPFCLSNARLPTNYSAAPRGCSTNSRVEKTLAQCGEDASPDNHSGQSPHSSAVPRQQHQQRAHEHQRCQRTNESTRHVVPHPERFRQSTPRSVRIVPEHRAHASWQVLRRSRYQRPMPPICMPIEQDSQTRTAQSAIVNERVQASLSLRRARCTRSLRSAPWRVPSRLPIAMQSCHGTPISHATGANR